MRSGKPPNPHNRSQRNHPQRHRSGCVTFTGVRDNKDTTTSPSARCARWATRPLRPPSPRPSGFVVSPGSIHRNGPNVVFQLTEQTAGDTNPTCKTGGPDCLIEVSYQVHRAPARHFQRQCPGPRRRHLRQRWRLPRHSASRPSAPPSTPPATPATTPPHRPKPPPPPPLCLSAR